MTKKSVTEIVGIIVEELTPLTSEERKRVVRASLALLGEETIKESKYATGAEPDVGEEGGSLPTRARVWMQQSDLSWDQVQQAFHVDGQTVEVIASEIPGKTNREKVRKAYVLAGIAQLLSIGEPKFTDKAARDLCETSGFYDSTNHAKYMKGGNEFTGSRERGWTLTSPGLKAGAGVIREIAEER